ncbi:unnamed protein product [Rhizophagus irregularis]|nr:unnamed protein product [Rhizophagus irregularis]
MYPTDALNVWEYKLSNWLKLYDDEQAGPSNTELTSHDYVRKYAEENLKTYTTNMKESILSTAKIVKYKIGDLVKLGCQFGVLDVSYSVGNLEPLKAHISGLEDIPRRKISLKEAARLQSALHEEVTTTITENLEITCKCPKTTCSTMHCPCKKEKKKCNTSCYPEKECSNL